MMGIGNVTELTHADTIGMNALLFGIASELGLAAVLVVQVSEHARSVVREADVARRIMYAARRENALPKDFSAALLALHEKRPFPHTPADIAEIAAAVRDPSFRVMLSDDGVHVFNRDRHHCAADPFALWPLLGLEHDAAHAFSTWAWSSPARRSRGSSASATPRTASSAGARRCRQCSTTSRGRAPRAPRSRTPGAGRPMDPGPTNELRMIWETVVTTRSSRGRVHIAPMGIRESKEGRVVLAPFRPSTTLDNVLATRVAAVNFTDDVRVIAGCLTGRPDWPTRACERVDCVRLDGALAHRELALARIDEDGERPRLHCDVVFAANHRPFRGFNRAQAAVVEGAILVSRLHMLPAEKIDTEMKYLAIAIDKTAGPNEREAWSWLVARIDAFRAEQAR